MSDNRVPRFADLRAIADRLSSRRECHRLLPDLEKAITAQSCLTDLKRVNEILRARKPTAEVLKDAEVKAAVDLSIFLAAVSLYGRATHTSLRNDGDRGSIGVRHLLSPDQQVMHDIVIEVRNKVLAHVYEGEVVADDIFHESLAVVIEQNLGWQPAIVSRQTYDSEPVWVYLEELSPVVTDLLRQNYTIKIDKFSEVMKLVSIPLEYFTDALIDPIEAFGSEEVVRSLLPGSSGVAYHRRNYSKGI